MKIQRVPSFIKYALTWVLLGVTASAEVITTRSDPVGQQLNAWFAAGTAAGLAAIHYENRDGQHSPLSQALFPQLQFIKQEGKDIGAARIVRPQPTIGNCSMASAPDQIGSLPRLYMSDPTGSRFLAQQYLNNNLFIYPEHLDHDPGSGGIGGYGDLYPLNTPTLLISQGSSLTDQPFLQALLATAAAFTPATQKFLIEKKILAPTLQYIFRRSNKNVTSDADYLTGKAHPVVFDSSQLDEAKMIRLAHEMTPETVPPIPVIVIKEESPLQLGIDYFEPPGTFHTALADTPVSIARIYRSHASEIGLVVDLSQSLSFSKQGKLGVRFALLQGDPRFIRIEQQPGATLARVRILWQPPVIGARGILSHRIDLGVIATDGTNLSAPAIISIYMLPNEMHYYDDKGRVTEVHYQTHNPDVGLPTTDTDLRWARLMQLISSTTEAPFFAQLTQSILTPAERQTITKLHQDIQERLKTANNVARDPKLKTEADKLRADATNSIAAALETKLPGEKPRTTRIAIFTALDTILSDPLFYSQHQDELRALAEKSSKTTALADLRAEIHRLSLIGILRQKPDGIILTTTEPKQLTIAERHALRGLNLTILSQIILPDVLDRSPAPAWVPPRLTAPRLWRDVMHYDTDSPRLTGWTRYHDARTTDFDATGRIIPPNAKSPPIPVTYQLDPEGKLTWRAEKK